jgi:hypothetical protein
MTVSTSKPPTYPDTVQALNDILASGFGFGGGNVVPVLAPVKNANAIATFAADSALGTVATGAAQLAPTQEETAATAAAAVASIREGFFGA